MRSKTKFGAFLSLVFVIALLAAGSLPAYAHHQDGHDGGPPEDRGRSEQTDQNQQDNGSGKNDEVNESNDGDADDASDPNVDDDDNAHPSGRDRSKEPGGSGNQGNAQSDPDDDGRGPDRSNGGKDQPGGSGGVDKSDQDGNNGCGNDDDFEDDNEGLCGGKRADRTAPRTDTPPKDNDTPPQGQGGNLACPAGFQSFKIDANPSGTYSDGTLTVTIFNNDGDSFSWTANQTVASVLVKGGPTTKINAGGTSGFAEAAFNPNSGKLYGISHVTFCYGAEDDDVLPQPPITKLCPVGTDNAGMPYDDIDECDDVDVRVDEVCPAGTDFAGMPMGNLEDCVLGTVIHRGGPEAPEVAPQAVLPFTGAGSISTFLMAALALITAGLAALKVRSTS